MKATYTITYKFDEDQIKKIAEEYDLDMSDEEDFFMDSLPRAIEDLFCNGVIDEYGSNEIYDNEYDYDENK